MANPIPPVIAYYRVSTERQGQSGLGLDAQRSAVETYVGDQDLRDEFLKVESGRKDKLPQLAAALARCRLKRAVLVIAKLDRRARSVASISNLMESGVEFMAVDMPEANRLTLHILAAVAEHEREAIPQRTRAALAAARAKGTRLGSPHPNMAMIFAAASANAAALRTGPMERVRNLKAQGRSLRAIASDLNSYGISSRRGRNWHAAGVGSLLLHDTVNIMGDTNG